MKGPQFLKYFNPILHVLREMGGAGNTAEVIDRVITYLDIPDSEVEELIPSGPSRVRNRIQWARTYLVEAGFIDASTRGKWQLTEKGFHMNLSEDEIEKVFKKAQKAFQERSKDASNTSDSETTAVLEEEHSNRLIGTIMGLSPSGFERLCKRLLTECGFQQVEVTGKTNDKGIDGIGLLEINHLVSFKVLFQCKRYKEAVTPTQVRDFRGAMQGRADKGIIITTGYFTKEARSEAIRDGVPPIELVDGEKLVELFEKFELGLKPKTVYDIDYSFFDEFK